MKMRAPIMKLMKLEIGLLYQKRKKKEIGRSESMKLDGVVKLIN